MNHLDILLSNLRLRVGSAVNDALENLIPPWCEGMDMAVWETEVGKEVAQFLWLYNQREAISVFEAIEIVFPGAGKSGFRRKFIYHHVPLYPRVREFYWYNTKRVTRNAKWYILRSDAVDLRKRIADGEFPKVGIGLGRKAKSENP